MKLERWVTVVLVAGLAACAGGGDDAATEGRREAGGDGDAAYSRAPAAAPAPAAPEMDAGALAGQGSAASPSTQPQVGADSSAPAMLIRTGSAYVEVEDVDSAAAAVRRLAQSLGGYVANFSVRGGEHEVRQATLEVKVPADRFERAVGGLEAVGEVETVDVQAQDVGEEFVDLTARLNNARRLEERLVSLLENRTGRLEDVLAVERELARVREQIDTHEGRLRYLRSRVALSTLTVTVHEPSPLLDGRGDNLILDALVRAWRIFVGVVVFLIASLGFVVPVGLVAAVVWWAWRRIRRRRAT